MWHNLPFVFFYSSEANPIALSGRERKGNISSGQGVRCHLRVARALHAEKERETTRENERDANDLRNGEAKIARGIVGAKKFNGETDRAVADEHKPKDIAGPAAFVKVKVEQQGESKSE